MSFGASGFDLCASQGERFGKLNEIDQNCARYAIKKAKLENIINGQRVQAIGFKNILFLNYKVKGKVKRFTVAGDKTFINEIKAVYLSKDENEIYVLDHNYLLVFDTLSSGNIAPAKVIKLKQNNCTQMAIIEKKNFYMLCGSQVILGSLEGDSRFKQKSRQPASLTYWDNKQESLGQDLIMKMYKDDLLILDKKNKKIVALNLSLQSASLWTLLLSEEIAASIKTIKVSSDSFTVVDSAGKLYSYE